MRRHGLTLLVDADDTLWENNIYFEEVIDAFCGLIEARGGSREQARDALYAIERVRTRTNGYGIKNFQGSLCHACRDLLGDDHAPEVTALEELCAALARRGIDILPAVEETLRELSGRHRMILFTKGDLDDQLHKVQRSGLSRFFHRVDVVREKDTESYIDAALRHGFRTEAAWMVGNSPKSDILPALEAGLGAVFIPHDRTWELERSELPAAESLAGRLLVLERFGDLTSHF
jgi:putative hydrolase of the HAD superfamily